MFFILISVNLVTYILCGKFIIDGNYMYGLIAFLFSLFISGCIGSLYIKKAQRKAELEEALRKAECKKARKKTKLNMDKSNPDNKLNMNKEAIPQKQSNTYFTDCFDLGDCVDVPLMIDDCNCGGAEHGFLGLGDCSDALDLGSALDCGGADCGGADCDCPL